MMEGARQKAISSFWKWTLTSKRSDGQRRATNSDQAIVWIGAYFARARENDFIMGRTARSAEHSNWRADLDYLISPKGRKQVIEKTGGAA
jgi:hypothetical protein